MEKVRVAGRCASFRIVCNGCKQYMEFTTASTEATVRLIEFAREHDDHTRVERLHGHVVTHYGVKRGVVG